MVTNIFVNLVNAYFQQKIQKQLVTLWMSRNLCSNLPANSIMAMDAVLPSFEAAVIVLPRQFVRPSFH